VALCNYLTWDKTVQTLDGVLSVVRDHRVLTSVMHRLPSVSFVSIEAYFSLDRASRFPL
jgi:hypothetical protein